MGFLLTSDYGLLTTNSSAVRQMMETLTLKVTGMTCGGCENAVKRGLTRLEGIGQVTASHAESQVAVTFDPGRVSPDEIRARIGAMGYTVVS